jgi:hypothetical protein
MKILPTRGAAGVLLVLTCSCASFPSAQAPARAAILPGSAVETILGQCSRDTPSAGEGTWQPAAADIIALEAALSPELLRRSASGDPDWATFPNAWLRQYVGIIRKGRRYVYGSFLPPGSSGYAKDPQEPFIICDGGPGIFGAEYDVEAGSFTHLAFNGAM